MNSRNIVIVVASAIFLLSAIPAIAQEYPKFNFNVGGGFGFNQGRLRDLAETSGHVVVGGGYNFNRTFGANVEYQFYNLAVHDSVIKEAQLPDATGRIDSVTGNTIVRFLSGKPVGAYGIGGGGWYRRHLQSQANPILPGTACNPNWVWWGAECVDGLVPKTIVLNENTDDAFGLNVGGGITFGVRDSGMKIYAEVRYHHSYGKELSTNTLPLTFGVRW